MAQTTKGLVRQVLRGRALLCALLIVVSASVTTAMLMASGGCGQHRSLKLERPKAHKRWARTRAEMLTGVAAEHLRTGMLQIAQTKAAEAMGLDPTYVPARIVMGQVALEQGKFADAAAYLQAAREQDPRNASAVYYLAVALEHTERYEDALRCYRQAYFLNDKSLEPVKGAAEVLAAMGKPQEALVYIEGFLDRAGDDAAMYELAGQLAQLTAEHDKACTYFGQAMILDDGNRMYRQLLGQSQLQAGKPTEAVVTLLALTKDTQAPASGLVYMLLGEAYLAGGKVPPAREAYLQATTLNKDNGRFRLGLAKVELAAGHWAQAASAAEHASQLGANDPDAQSLLAYALMKSGRTDDALRLLGHATRQYPRDTMLWCMLGRAHAAAGDPQAATRCYSTALQIDPQNSFAQELLRTVGGPPTRTQ